MTNILSHHPAGRSFNYTAATAYAVKTRRVGAWRIGLELVLLSRGRGQLKSDDYFLQGAWRPGLSWAERKAFIGTAVSTALNSSLNPPIAPGEMSPIVDKMASLARFSAAGLAHPRVLAVASETAGDAGTRWLDSPEATLAFLQSPGTLPCFGKPVHGSLAEGAASFVARDDDGQIVLGTGQKATPEALVAEIWRDFARGYVFQELVRPHPDLAALIGPVIGTLRVATIDAGQGPEVLYAVIKLPAAGAMVDSSSGPLGGFGAVDTASGRILRLQDRRQMGGTDLATNAVTGAAMVGATVPDYAEALRLACAAHGCFPGQGLLGVDILLSDRGPLVNEVNVNPHHAVYQTAFARGLLNPDLLPKLSAARNRFRATAPKMKHAPIP